MGLPVGRWSDSATAGGNRQAENSDPWHARGKKPKHETVKLEQETATDIPMMQERIDPYVCVRMSKNIRVYVRKLYPGPYLLSCVCVSGKAYVYLYRYKTRFVFHNTLHHTPVSSQRE